MIDDLSRRGFLELTGSSALAALSGGDLADQDGNVPTDYEFDEFGLLIGPEAARPDPDSDFFDQYSRYRLVYFATDTGEKSHISDTTATWTTMPTPFTGPTTQVDEVRTENYTSFFNHTFARPGAPDDKNWEYTDADVTKQDSEVELASTTQLQSLQRGNYPAGSEAVPGVAFRLPGTPTAGSAEAGYFTAQNGGGAGEDATDSYVFLRKGGTTHKVYRSDWNGYVPDERLWVGNRPVITRMPHLFYGGGDFEVRAIVHGETGSKLRTLHTFTPENVDDSFGQGPPFDQPNLPVTFSSDSLSGGALRANAAHYEFGEVESENRVNGEHFTGIEAGTSGWTPLMIWRKRDGWDMVNVQPLKISVAASGADAKLALQLNPSVTVSSSSLPTNTSSDETSVEIVDGTLDTPGERRWVGYVTAGQGNQPSSVSADGLTFNLPATQPVTVVAQGVGSTATLSGTVAWEEYF